MAFLKKPSVRRWRYRLLRFGARGLICATAILPRKAGLFLFGTAGSLLYLIPHADRKRTIDHLRLIYGSSWTHETILKTARSVYIGLGRNLFDSFYLPRLSPEAFNSIVTHDPIDKIRKEYAKGRGGIVITAHTGCWEMLLHFFPMHGFKSFAIGKKLRDPELDRMIGEARRGSENVYLDRSEPPRRIVRHLKEGRLFGVLIDQDTSVEGVFAEFLGRIAHTPSGPLKMAMRMRLPVFVATTVRQPDDSHHVFIEGPLSLQEGNGFEEDLLHNVAMVNRIICGTIERYPDQWVWMHRRWRRGDTEKNAGKDAGER